MNASYTRNFREFNILSLFSISVSSLIEIIDQNKQCILTSLSLGAFQVILDTIGGREINKMSRKLYFLFNSDFKAFRSKKSSLREQD